MSLLDTDLQILKAGSGYKFSATKFDVLAQGASDYTMVTIAMDTSTSVEPYSTQLEQMLKTILLACQESPRKNNLLLRLLQFNSTVSELHGFKLLSSINPDDYNGILRVGGMTALCEAMDDGIQATSTYGKQLTAQDFLCNAIMFTVTDGEGNAGNINSGDLAQDAEVVKKSLVAAKRSENLESFLNILVGVTNDDNSLNTYLQTLKDGAGMDQYISIGKATPRNLAKLADFVSKSISSTSTKLGSGQASTPLNPSQFNF